MSYVLALIYEKNERKIVIWFSVICCTAVLFVFKYHNYFLGILSRLLPETGFLNLTKNNNLILPVGISFYTFQIISYLIDIKRHVIKPEHNIINYFLFLLFFCYLTSGPISRAKDVLPQICNLHKVRPVWSRIEQGLILILFGYFSKMVVADHLTNVVGRGFEYYTELWSGQLLIASLFYTIEIYADFMGYSCIAIGLAKTFGIDLHNNFCAPYYSSSIKDFWRRWHISLSTWLRDYIYIPLGGGRKGEIRKLLNIIIVFMISGFWHGAGFNYLIWGGLHAFYQIAEEFCSKIKMNKKNSTNIVRWFRRIIVFAGASLAWIFFRAGSTTTAVQFILRMFSAINPTAVDDPSVFSMHITEMEIIVALTAIVILASIDYLQYHYEKRIDDIIIEKNWIIRWAFELFLLFMILMFGNYDIGGRPTNFLYFQY